MILARNPYNNEFAGRMAFFSTNGVIASATCDRKEFIGRNGSLNNPAALRRTKLAGRDGAGLDPCAALQTTVELAPGEAREIVFLIGAAGYGKLAEIVSPVIGSLRAESGCQRREGSLQRLDETPDSSIGAPSLLDITLLDLVLSRIILSQS